jgi:hypothetical protein
MEDQSKPLISGVLHVVRVRWRLDQLVGASRKRPQERRLPTLIEGQPNSSHIVMDLM